MVTSVDSDSALGLAVCITSAPEPMRHDALAWLREYGRHTLELPGVRSVTVAEEGDRYGRPRLASDDFVTWLTYEDVDVSALAEVLLEKRAREAADGESRRVLGAVSRREHRTYRPVTVPHIARAADSCTLGNVINCVWWTPEPGTEDQFTAWYNEEHIPLIMPDRLRIRRYSLIDGTGPAFLAMHDIASSDMLTDADARQRIAATRTGWRERMVATRQQYDSKRFVVRDRLPTAPVSS
jgi:hypothetical protein